MVSCGRMRSKIDQGTVAEVEVPDLEGGPRGAQ